MNKIKIKFFLKTIYNTLYKNVVFEKKYTQKILDEEKKQRQVPKYNGDIKFSIFVIQKKNNLGYLEKLKESIQHQNYTNWEVYIHSIDEDLRSKAPVKFCNLTGDYIIIVDQNDLLAPTALFECYNYIKKRENVDILYSDSDEISKSGRKFSKPQYKPDFSVDFIRSRNYIGELLVVKRKLIENTEEYQNFKKYDFILKLIEKAKCIEHIPKVLYHKRKDDIQIDINEQNNDIEALKAYYQRNNIAAEVRKTIVPGVYHTQYKLEEFPKVSIIIPNKDNTEVLKRCLESIQKRSTYDNYEILIVENNSVEEATFRYYDEIEKIYSKVKICDYKGIFNYSKINNFAVSKAEGEYYIFLNNDTEIISENWIEELLGNCMRSEVGVVGAKLYYPNNLIQHAGIVVGYRDAAAHAFINCMRNERGYLDRCICTQNYLAVTGACMMVKGTLFHKVKGFDEELQVAYNDVDLCLKIYEAGYLIVYDAAVELYHYESYSRGLDISEEKKKRLEKERKILNNKWKCIYEKGDPYYNPNLTKTETIFSVEL